MQKVTKSLSNPYLATVAAAAAFGLAATAQASFSLDGSLSPGEGYGSTPLVTQVNVTTSGSADGGGSGGPGDEATATNTSRLNQMSNAYAYIDTTTTPGSPVLHLFIGGSVEQNTADTHVELALQTASGGVSNLTGQNLPGGLPDVKFQGFSPNVLFTFTPFDSAEGTAGDGSTTVKDLTNASAAPVTVASNHTGSDAGGDLLTVGMATNDALDKTAIGAAGEPSFASVTTGMEFAIPLDTLPGASTSYTSGNIKAFLFFAEGSSTRTNNQLLSPFDYGGDPSGSFDYTYIDTNSGVDPTARQFGSVVYPVDTSAANPGGSQYFTIPGAAVPEPASMGLLGLCVAGLLGRRARKI